MTNRLSYTVYKKRLLRNDSRRVDDYRLVWHISMHAKTARWYAAHFVDNIHAASDFTKYGVAPTLHVFARVI